MDDLDLEMFRVNEVPPHCYTNSLVFCPGIGLEC